MSFPGPADKTLPTATGSDWDADVDAPTVDSPAAADIESAETLGGPAGPHASAAVRARSQPQIRPESQNRTDAAAHRSIADTVRDVMDGPSASGKAAAGDRYDESREIGRGGMGRVAEARDRWLGRRVAIKHLLAKGNSGLQRRFELEALITAQLDHPGVPTVYERGSTDGEPWYTMRLVEGEQFSTLLRNATTTEQRLPYLPVLAAVAQTLAHAHEQGVIHRDIKPENVVVGNHGQAVLLDWGIAKVRGLAERAGPDGEITAGPEGLTLHGSVLGTPAYMAPEQARGETAAIDERCDVFALGAMLFHILAGHPPYRGKTLTDVLQQARAAEVPDIDKLVPQAPQLLRDLARRAMHPDPAQRPANAGEFVQGLTGFMVEAILTPKSRGLERFVAASSWFGLVVCLLLALMGWRMSPTLREMGAAAYGVVAFSVVGLCVDALEWRTSGRHHLMPVGVALMAITAVSAWAGAQMGMLNVYQYLLRPEVLNDAVKYREIFAMGSREATGNIPFGLTLALLQGCVLALAWRRTRLAQGGEGRGP